MLKKELFQKSGNPCDMVLNFRDIRNIPILLVIFIYFMHKSLSFFYKSIEHIFAYRNMLYLKETKIVLPLLSNFATERKKRMMKDVICRADMKLKKSNAHLWQVKIN